MTTIDQQQSPSFDFAGGEVVSNVVPLPQLDARRRTELQRALDAVPISLSYAAGIASVLLAYGHSPRARRAEIERLRGGWHGLVDDAVAHALDDVAS